jgi:hypothetical protein
MSMRTNPEYIYNAALPDFEDNAALPDSIVGVACCLGATLHELYSNGQMCVGALLVF